MVDYVAQLDNCYFLMNTLKLSTTFCISYFGNGAQFTSYEGTAAVILLPFCLLCLTVHPVLALVLPL